MHFEKHCIFFLPENLKFFFRFHKKIKVGSGYPKHRYFLFGLGELYNFRDQAGPEF